MHSVHLGSDFQIYELKAPFKSILDSLPLNYQQLLISKKALKTAKKHLKLNFDCF